MGGVNDLNIFQANPVLKDKQFFFQAEDGIRDVERSRGLGDVYKRQVFAPNNNSVIAG